MELYHFLFTPKSGLMRRILSSYVTPEVATAYQQSNLLKEVVLTPGGSKVLALDTGDWVYPLLQKRGVDRGIPFAITSFDLDSVKMMEPAEVSMLVQKSNFAWATTANLVTVKFPNYSGFDLKPFGLKVTNNRKLTKRILEVLRCSGHYVYDPEAEITLREFVTPDGHDDTFYDGMNVIRESLANRLGFDYKRGWIRALTPLGLIKGDFVVVPDSMLDADIVYHTENMKAELATNGWQMVTAMKHGPLYDMGHNDQIRGNFSYFIPARKVAADIDLLVHNWKEGLKEGGELYDYLSSQQMAFDDPIAVDIDRIDMGRRLEEQAELLKDVGIPPAVFSNIAYTRTGAMARKMRAHQLIASGKRLPIFKRMFIPASNAFSAAVVTWEALTEMAGITFPGEDGTRTFFSPDYGLVVPGSRFRDTYDLHGGWDLDDTLSIFAMKVYCSDKSKTKLLRTHGVLDPAIKRMPSSPKSAKLVGLAIRMPNGPGEYSIELLSEDMPWSFYSEDTIPVVDLAGAPLPQDLVFAESTLSELEPSVDYTDEFNHDFVEKMVVAQVNNPNVGPFANAVMVAAATFGPDNIPPHLMTLKMEDCIDTVQQEADILKFGAIQTAVHNMWIDFTEYVITNDIKVDRGLLATRVPARIGMGDESVPIAEAIIDAGLYCDGDTYKLHNKYTKAIDEIAQLGQELAKRTRNNTELAVRISKGKFNPEYETFAVGWIRGCMGALRRLDNQMKVSDGNTESTTLDAIARKEQQTARRLATEALMDQWVDAITSNQRLDTHKQVMALYKLIVTPTQKFPLGDLDRVFVQPSSYGHTSMLQLFIEGCKRWNLLPDTTIIKANRLD